MVRNNLIEKEINQNYRIQCSFFRQFCSFLFFYLKRITSAISLPLLIALLVLFFEYYLENSMPFLSDSSVYFSDVAFVTFGVFISIVVAIIFKEEKIFGKPFSSLYFSLIISGSSFVGLPIFWSVGFFGFVIWARTTNSSLDLGIASVFLFLCSLTSIFVGIGQVLLNREKLWISYCQRQGFLVKRPFFKRYRHSFVHWFRCSEFERHLFISGSSIEPLFSSLEYLIDCQDKGMPLFPDFDYFFALLKKWPSAFDSDSDLLSLCILLNSIEKMVKTLSMEGEEKNAGKLLDECGRLLLALKSSKPLEKSLKNPLFSINFKICKSLKASAWREAFYLVFESTADIKLYLFALRATKKLFSLLSSEINRGLLESLNFEIENLSKELKKRSRILSLLEKKEPVLANDTKNQLARLFTSCGILVQ